MEDLEIIREIETLLEVKLESVERIVGIDSGYVLQGGKIVTLSICNNQIIHKILDKVGSLLNKLESLKDLRIINCELINITPLQDLKQLTKLYLHSNQISDITPLKELKKLEDLYLLHNQISDLNPLQELKQLTRLNLENNKISDITPLQELKKLILLDLSYNQIKKLSWKLIEPFENIFFKSSLNEEGLILFNNPITEPPLEVLKEGYEAVKDYFEQREKYGTDIFYEGKILIAGEAGAGKSTLFKKLQIPEIEQLPDTKSTLGVMVKEGLRLPHPEKLGVEMIANMWDFGGQEIQYNLHQYFITSGALNILVSDNRKQNTQWDYWFQIIELLAGQCTTLVVLNNVSTISSKSDFEKTKFANRFPNINIVQCEVDFAINDGKWTALQEDIRRLFAELPLVNQLVPQPWVDLRNALNEKRNTGHNYIYLDDFYQLKTRKAITQEEKKSALDYFCKIGIVTHFPEDKNLRSTIFLNPNWITQGLYAAISSDNKDMENGKFSEKWICEFWSKHENKYGETEQNYLLSLMLRDKFDICYELENGKYIIPFLLPVTPPENINWNDTDNMGFKIQYPFMPKGILSRLTVQLNEMIENNLVWREGVIFKKHKSRAKVISDYDPQSGLKYIDIKIYGASSNIRRDLLQLIRYKIEEIHKKSFQNVNCKELVSCNCNKCRNLATPHYFSITGDDGIEGYLEAGKTEIECPKLKDRVNIDDLIGPIYTEEEIKRMKPKEKDREEDIEENTPVYIKDVLIKDFKCFKGENSFSFVDDEGQWCRWTVFLGNNNTGKTNLLKAIASLEPCCQSNTTGTSHYQPLLEEEIDVFFNAIPFSIGLNAVSPYKSIDAYKAEYNFDNYVEYDKYYGGSSANSDENLKFLSIYGYGVTRNIESKGMKAEEKKLNADNLFYNSNLINFEDWLFQLDYAAKNQSSDKNNQKKAAQRRDLLKEVLISEIFPEINDIRFISNKALENYIEFQTTNGWYKLSELGFGYQASLSWLCDFCKKMFDRYPNSENPLKEPAVLLIDELDLHLHPQWQREIVKDLSNIFTTTQFIVTTHSPFILQSMDNVNLYTLQCEGDHTKVKHHGSNHSFVGWRIEEILSEIMGLKDNIQTDTYQKWMKQFDEALDEENYSKGKKAFEALEKILHPQSVERKLLDIQFSQLIPDDKV